MIVAATGETLSEKGDAGAGSDRMVVLFTRHSTSALRLAYLQHREFATTLKGVPQQRTVGDTFAQTTGAISIR